MQDRDNAQCRSWKAMMIIEYNRGNKTAFFRTLFWEKKYICYEPLKI